LTSSLPFHLYFILLFVGLFFNGPSHKVNLFSFGSYWAWVRVRFENCSSVNYKHFSVVSFV